MNTLSNEETVDRYARLTQIYVKLHHESWVNKTPVSDVDMFLERIENDAKLRHRFRVAMGLSSPIPIAPSTKEEDAHPFTQHNSDSSVIYHSEASGGDHNTRPMPKTPQMLKLKNQHKNKTVSFDNSTRVYSSKEGDDKNGDGSISNPYLTLERAWKHALTIASTTARITVYGYYRGDRLYASAVNEDTADFVADKVAGMEFIDEHVDENGRAEYMFRVARDARIDLQLLRDKVMGELKRLNLLNHTVWNFDTTLRSNNVEIWCPDSTPETAGHRPSSPKRGGMNSKASTPRTKQDMDLIVDHDNALIPISGEQLYDELLKMGLGMAVGKISIIEMASYVHDGGGGIFTLGGKKASLEFDALIRNVRGQGKLTTYFLSMVFAAGTLAGCGLV